MPDVYSCIPSCSSSATSEHCWHVDEEDGPGGIAKKCCFCGTRIVKRSIPSPDHGPFIKGILVTRWVVDK